MRDLALALEPPRSRKGHWQDRNCRTDPTELLQTDEANMRTTFQLAPVIADIIAAHCPHTVARRTFMRACIHEDWQEAKGMVQGMLAEPWLLRGYQETRLREFLELLPDTEAVVPRHSARRATAV